MNWNLEQFTEGKVLLINKPLEWTSFDVVNKMRYLLRFHYGIKKIKVGHAGTLDPLATGLVIVCTGKATKQIDQFLGMDKQYLAKVTFGATTPTYDLESEPDALFPHEHISAELLKATLKKFEGEQAQMPPHFSALKVNGKKAYEMARKGEKVELKPRTINISDIQLLEYQSPTAIIDVQCSKGTYIRSLAFDLGKALDSGAHLSGLERTRIGTFQLSEAMTIEEFEKKLASSVTN